MSNTQTLKILNQDCFQETTEQTYDLRKNAQSNSCMLMSEGW